MSLRSGKLAGTVYWPDGTTLFNGTAQVVLVVPGQNGAETLWPRLTVDQGYPTVQVPKWTQFKVRDGVFDQGTALWYNGDIVPHGSTYAARYYDSAGVLVGGPTGLFSVAEATVTPPVSITVSPTAGTIIPEPSVVY